MESTRKKTPSDTSEFEREQLRFFLSRADVGEKLVELNPSLAWLPELQRMQVIQSAVQLAPWIEKNFGDPEAVREIAGNLKFFDEAVAERLEWRLNHYREKLPPVLTKSWQLIIRHIRDHPRNVLRSEWFDIEPRMSAGEHSAELLERTGLLLRPKPKISKRVAWNNDEQGDRLPKRPSDLMSIEYEADSDVSENEILEAWPKKALANVEKNFLSKLADSLDAALADALDSEVENDGGYGISDTDVASVAEHPQNEYRRGFLPIVRVIAEIWTRLVRKNASLALPFVLRWSSSTSKLNKRLALFAAADSAVEADIAADVLLELPQELFFLTSAAVEVFRLIRERWNEFSTAKRNSIEARLIAGPPAERFVSEADLHVDRARFDILGEMERAGLELSKRASSVLSEIRQRYPKWQLRPAEQAGFLIWFGGVSGVVGDSQKLQHVPIESLIEEAKKLEQSADFLEGDNWQALCQDDPQRALAALESESKKGCWPSWAWNPLLWATQKLDSPESIALTGELLLIFPEKEFATVANGASWWLNSKEKSLDEDILWRLWDKIEGAVAQELTVDA